MSAYEETNRTGLEPVELPAVLCDHYVEAGKKCSTCRVRKFISEWIPVMVVIIIGTCLGLLTAAQIP